MMIESYKGGIGICAGMLMIKWDEIKQMLSQHPIQINPGDNVNVYINFETILNNLSQRKNLIQDVYNYKQNICLELEASILNLVAHYRAYFKIKHKAEPKIYLYYTDLKDESTQQMSVYNKYYRSYYHNRYMQNPKFKEMGELMTGIIIPEIILILSYIKDCYFIKSNSFDGSLIPKIISDHSEAKNVIISGDIFDTLYMYDNNMIMLYVNRKYQYFKMAISPEEVVRSIIKTESPFDITIFNSKMYFQLLLSIKGSKVRNIKSAKWFGYNKLTKVLNEGMKNGTILPQFSSIDSILEIFPEQYREDIKTGYLCTSIENQMALIGNADVSNIMSQIVDKIDTRSVEALNNKRFFDFPINLPYLLG